MHRSCLEWNRAVSALAALVLLATGANIGRGAPAPKPDPPKPQPEYIVTAWKEAGAEVGWMRYYKSGFRAFVGEKEGQPGDLPAFQFDSWQDGRLAKLPIPETAFGLSLC